MMRSMRAPLSTLLLLAITSLATVAAFAPSAALPRPPLRTSTSHASATSPRMSASNDPSPVPRRIALTLASLAALSVSSPAHAGKARGGSLPTDEGDGIETPEERKERKKLEREQYRANREAIEQKAKELNEGKQVKEAEMGSNLRGDYYYPTSRKRYLPRIKAAYEKLVELTEGDIDLAAVSAAAENTIDVAGPLKLYISALSGGGLSINAAFMGQMKTESAGYEATFKDLAPALKKKKTGEVKEVLEKLKTQLLGYRSAGKPVGLTGDDWGVGAIPDCKSEISGVGKMSSCAVGSSFGNANPNLYNRNIKKGAAAKKAREEEEEE